ncbi:MAG TPA: MFS transporter, partial [Candidatus Methylomirabilis sp.]|nr:MFS transporter [Candidatus Methylomirabilis sp.]
EFVGRLLVPRRDAIAPGGTGTMIRERSRGLKLAAITAAHGATDGGAVFFLPLLPLVMGELGLGALQAGVLVAVYNLTSSFLQLPLALLSDLSGKNRVFFAAGLALSGVVFIAFGHAQGYLSILLLMVLAGVGASTHHPQAVAILAEEFADQRGFAIGCHGVGGSLGMSLYPLVTGVAALYMGWRQAIQLVALPGLLVAVAVFVVLPERAPRPWSLRELAGNFRVGILQNRPLLLLLLTSTFRIMGQKGIVVFIPLFASQVLGLGSGATGLLVSVFYGLGVLSQPVAGRLSDRHGRTLILSLLLAAGGLLTLAMTRVASPTGAFLVSGVLGFVLLAVRPVIHAEATELSRQGLQSTTMGVIFGVNEGIASLSAVLGGWVAEAFGLKACFAFFALVLLGGACLAMLLERVAPLPLPRPAGGAPRR